VAGFGIRSIPIIAMTSKMNGHEKLHGDDSMALRDDGGLLMRFFESEFFDAWIAVRYVLRRALVLLRIPDVYLMCFQLPSQGASHCN
jgi:hypothetical protein